MLARAIVVAAVVLGDGLAPGAQVAVLAVLEAALAVLASPRGT